ncbi:MAG TPA: lipid-binding SYLF domain-containing protein [Alphaproteobacteria bacterium]|nr:lipid-binding SYLF domain-containing protein [Alphaproteobacteria bacterium]
MEARRSQAHALARVRPMRALCLLIASAVVVLAATLAARAADDPNAKAAALVASVKTSLDTYFSQKEWEAVRNFLGGARAIYVAPTVTKLGFIVGFSGGDGVLLRRHGDSWSDPVFLAIKAQSVGMQLGAQESNLVMLIMTDAGVDDLLAGVSKVGGTSGFALASWGAGASAGGGAAGGLQVLTVSTNSGLFGGGGLERSEMQPSKDYNDAIYGQNADLKAVAAGNGSGKASAAALQALLKQATTQAWAIGP